MATPYIYKRNAGRLFIAVRNNGKRYKIYLPKESNPIINEKEENITFVEHKNNSASFQMNGENYKCEITEQTKNKVTVMVNGIEYQFSLESIFSYLRQGLLNKKETTEQTNIISHMPGKIVDVFVSEGDIVNAGEPIVSLEAMKMQNELTANCNGVVRKIHVVAGQTVMQNELLVEISLLEKE